jgi:RsiW-degrading membrane proteinase PrsW (M82 family)
MECLITSLGFELFENIIYMELDSTLTNHEAIANIAIAKRCWFAFALKPFGHPTAGVAAG